MITTWRLSNLTGLLFPTSKGQSLNISALGKGKQMADRKSTSKDYEFQKPKELLKLLITRNVMTIFQSVSNRFPFNPYIYFKEIE